MKKVMLVLAMFLAVLQSKAETSDAIFDIETKTCEAQLQPLMQLEQNIAQRGQISYQQLAQEQNTALAQAAVAQNLDTYFVATSKRNAMPLVPPFVWGLCLSVAGLAAVYFITQDDSDIRWAFFGCVISTLIFGFGLFGIFG